MNVSTSGTPTLCRRCGQFGPGGSPACPHCGSPLTGATTPPARPPSRPVLTPPAGEPVHRFPPAAVTAGPELRLSRKTWLRVGAAGAAVVVAVAAFLLLWEPPSPAGAVEDYLERLGDGDTATALEMSGYGMGFSPDEAPLLVPAALADEANRPSDVSVKATQDLSGDGRYAMVTATYRLGEQTIEQDFAVAATEDDETPYRLEQPFLYLSVSMPSGMDVTVNGVAVPASRVSRGTPVFPGLYTATTSGNTLFAGSTGTAVYDRGRRGVGAEIDLGRLTVAPGAAAAVQDATERYLETNCVNTQTYRYGCPLRAPSFSWGQTTTWAVTAYPKVQVAPADTGRSQVRFTTATPGSAGYTVTYTEFGGAEKTETGTQPIEISGSAAIGDDGAIEITLGY